MQKKHLGKIVGLLALLFASSFGQTVETLMKQGASYSLKEKQPLQSYSRVYFDMETII